MSGSRLPLPLELTEPVLLAGDLDTLVRRGYSTSSYDPKTQLCSYADGTDSSCDQESQSISENVVIDLPIDIQVDDLIDLSL
jgi:hypothetical protein